MSMNKNINSSSIIIINKANADEVLAFNDKTQQWEHFGLPQSETMINRVTIPMLLDGLNWSAQYVLGILESTGFPYTHHPKLAAFKSERYEAQQAAEREAEERRIAYEIANPSEEVLKNRERIHQQRVAMGQQIAAQKGRGVPNLPSIAYTADFM